MKKTKIAGICLIVLILVAFVSVPVYNNYCAYNAEKMLCETPLPEQTELIEAISQTGKLTGNGNGMQYFGAILIKSELSLEELETYYSDYRSNEWEYLVEIQEGQSIKVIEHKALQFSEEIEDSGYYIVYSWGSGNSLLKELDCIFRKNCASVPEERSAIPLQTEQSSAGLLVTVVYSTIPARKFKTICLGCHSA